MGAKEKSISPWKPGVGRSGGAPLEFCVGGTFRGKRKGSAQ